MTDDKVISIDRRPVEETNVNHGVVTLLERLLGEARAGRMTGVMVCYTVPDGDDIIYKSDWSGPRLTLLGAITRCQYAMNVEFTKEDKGRIGG